MTTPSPGPVVIGTPMRLTNSAPDRIEGVQIVLVLAAYNEEQNLGPLLQKTIQQSREMRVRFHVIVVDDGSTDRTWETILAFSKILPLTAIRHTTNQGLGRSLADGVAAAVKIAGDDDLIVTMDADESHPPGLIPRMFGAIREGRDVVIASRFRPNSHLSGISFSRQVMSYGAAIVSKAIFPIRGVRDYTCGFRAFSGYALRLAYQTYGPAFIDQTGFQCTVDILLKMRRLPLIFGEVPMVLRYDLKKGPSKLPALKTVMATLRLLARRRFGNGGIEECRAA